MSDDSLLEDFFITNVILALEEGSASEIAGLLALTSVRGLDDRAVYEKAARALHARDKVFGVNRLVPDYGEVEPSKKQKDEIRKALNQSKRSRALRKFLSKLSILGLSAILALTSYYLIGAIGFWLVLIASSTWFTFRAMKAGANGT
jgi:hypothetical protein